MSNFDDVDALPTVPITAPPPALSGDQIVWHMGGGVKAETSFVYGVLATIAGRKGEWSVMSVQEFHKLGEEDSGWMTLRQNTVPILIQHHHAGLVRLLRYQDQIYVMPTEALLEQIQSAKGDRPFVA